MAFAKTPKRIRIAVLSVHFKIGLKLQVKKIRNFQFPAQQHFSGWTANCQELNLRLLLNFQPPWPISQTLRLKSAVFTCLWNHSVLQNGELSFPNGQSSISWYFFSRNPKCRFILFQYTNVYFCAKFGELKPSKNKRVEGAQGGISIVQLIQLCFLLSLGRSTSNEANKSTMPRSEWTITARRAVHHLAQMKYLYFVPERCKQNAIFSVQVIKTGHISIICRQTGDILLVSSKGSAAAKWRMKISR